MVRRARGQAAASEAAPSTITEFMSRTLVHLVQDAAGHTGKNCARRAQDAGEQAAGRPWGTDVATQRGCWVATTRHTCSERVGQWMSWPTRFETSGEPRPVGSS